MIVSLRLCYITYMVMPVTIAIFVQLMFIYHNILKTFIESIVDPSWVRYLATMSMSGTWADHVIIQAVADAMNLKIHAIESSQNFADITVVELANILQNLRPVFIKHISEIHCLPPPRRLCFHACLSVCLSVNRFTQKLMNGFAPNLVQRSQIYPGSID